MIHWGRLNNSACALKYSSRGTSPPPTRYWIRSKGYRVRLVNSANFLASVDLAPPVLPKTATFFPLTSSSRDAHQGAQGVRLMTGLASDHRIPTSQTPPVRMRCSDT